jgi:hypothetical protein
MNLRNLKFDLPSRWKEVSRSGNDNQINVRICHVSPLAKVDPKNFQDQPISSNEHASVSKIAIPTPSGIGGSFGDYFKGMSGFIASGFAPAYMTPVWLEDLRKKMTQTPGAEIPDESDITATVTIIQYADKNIAEQSFKNIGGLATAGFGGMVVPGAKDPKTSKDMTFADLFESDVLKAHVSKEQLAQMKKMSEVLRKETPKMKVEIKKAGLAYTEGKYLGFRALFSEMPNPTPPPKPAKPYKCGGMGGSRGNNMYAPLPKISQPSYQKTIKTCQAILIKNFVISGGLLGMASFLPEGNMPCYSLSKTEKRLETVEGIKSTYIVPTVSNYSKEGYFCKEDAEEVNKKILSKVASL